MNQSMHTLITGANRGIGLALAREFRARDHAVTGTARDTASARELAATGARVEAMDVADEASVRAAAHRLADAPLDILINNAGVFPDHGKNLFDLSAEATLQGLRVNSVGPLIVGRAFVPHLERGQRRLIVNISSTMGSLARAAAGSTGSYAYRASKAALNMLTICAAAELKPRGIAMVTMHPGWVQTDMGGSQAELPVADAARMITDVVLSLTIERTGRYIDYHGAELPW